jgi:hypothetical protein
MRHAVAVLTLLLPLLPVAAAGQGPATPPVPAGAPAPPSATERLARRLPPDLLGYRRLGEPAPMHRGNAVRYAAADGERILISVTLFATEASGTAEEELRRASAETEALAEGGRYRSVTARAPAVLRPADPAASLHCASFTLEPQRGRASADGICVALQSGHVVKVRVKSLSRPDADRAGRMAAEMAGAVGQVLALAR